MGLKDHPLPSSCLIAPCGRFQCLNEISQYLSSFPDHDIVIVTIANAQDISSYTVASTGQRELFYCLIKFVPGDKRKRKSEKKEAKHE